MSSRSQNQSGKPDEERARQGLSYSKLPGWSSSSELCGAIIPSTLEVSCGSSLHAGGRIEFCHQDNFMKVKHLSRVSLKYVVCCRKYEMVQDSSGTQLLEKACILVEDCRKSITKRLEPRCTKAMYSS